jgi:hypothetical protein
MFLITLSFPDVTERKTLWLALDVEQGEQQEGGISFVMLALCMACLG